MKADDKSFVIPLELLRAANRDYGTRGRVRINDPFVERVPIICADAIVGFYTPHTSADGHVRIGPLYVSPEYRGRGLALAVYRELQGPMLAYVEHGNEASVQLHKRAGFSRWRRYSHGWCWRRA